MKEHFTLSDVESKMNEGYKVKSVKLRLTRISGASHRRGCSG